MISKFRVIYSFDVFNEETKNRISGFRLNGGNYPAFAVHVCSFTIFLSIVNLTIRQCVKLDEF